MFEDLKSGYENNFQTSECPRRVAGDALEVDAQLYTILTVKTSGLTHRNDASISMIGHARWGQSCVDDGSGRRQCLFLIWIPTCHVSC